LGLDRPVLLVGINQVSREKRRRVPVAFLLERVQIEKKAVDLFELRIIGPDIYQFVLRLLYG
jgi:hypothetical protein